MVHSSRVNTLTSFCTKVKMLLRRYIQASECMHIPLTTKLEYALKSLVTKGQLALTCCNFNISDALLTYTFYHTGSPIVASITFNISSNTLTCTSTGGPATAVTWRRNGVVITLNATYQQTKRVVDLVEGTYQTVLTINSSVDQSVIVGTYNCTVENARGRSSMKIGKN